MTPWNPESEPFRQAAVLILTGAHEAAIRYMTDGERRSERELAAGGSARGGAAIRAGESLAAEAVDRFAMDAWPELLALVRAATGDPPPAAARLWLRETFTQRVDALVRGLGGRLVERRERQYISTRGADEAVLQAAARAKRDAEIALAKLELRSIAARQVVGAVVADFLGLAREALSQGAQNVAAVLVAAAFEHTIRRMGEALAGVEGRPALSDVLQALKTAGVLVEAPLTTALGFRKFRNDALHADWAQIGRPVIESCRAFVEELLVKHFS